MKSEPIDLRYVPLIVMKYFFILLVIIVTNSFGQDTIGVKFKQEPLQIPINDCAHGHICCEFDCPCCPQLKRSQEYDTMGVLRDSFLKHVSIIMERHRYANSHKIRTVFIAIQVNGKTTNWFPLNPIKDIDEYKNGGNETPRFFINEKQDEVRYFEVLGDQSPIVWQYKELIGQTTIGAIVEENYSIFGLIEQSGELVGEELFSDFERTDDGYLIIQHVYDDFLGVIDESGKLIIPMKYRKIRYLGYDLFAVREGFNSWQIVDQNGNKKVLRKAASVGDFTEGYLAVNFDRGGTIYLDTTGKTALRTKAEYGEDFSDGVASVMIDQQWGLINKEGEFVLDFQFERLGPFKDGVAPVKDRRVNSRMPYFLINKQGELVSQAYSNINMMKDGLALCFVNGKGYGFLNSQGEEVVPTTYYKAGYGSYSTYFPYNRLPVRIVDPDNKFPYSVINKSLDTLFEIKGVESVNYLHTYNDPYNVLPYFLVRKRNRHTLITVDNENVISDPIYLIEGLNKDLILLNSDDGRGNAIYSLSKDRIVKSFGRFKIHKVYDSFVVIEHNNGSREIIVPSE